MPWYDLPLERLREYRAPTAEPPGLDEWWAKRLDDTRALARPLELRPYQADLYRPLEVYDAEFSGAGGDRIRGWYIKPAAAALQRDEVAVCHADVPYVRLTRLTPNA